MSMQRLGSHFDIHGGGQDLQFPHHENEIAQSEAYSGEKFVNIWMHAGFVRVNEEKMSKSLGNFFTIREILRDYPPGVGPEVVRFFLLSSHYRSPLNYSTENLDQAEKTLTRLYLALRGLPPVGTSGILSAYEERFQAAMDDDFNTPEALAVLSDLAREVFIQRTEKGDLARAAELGARLRQLGGILGILQQEPEAFLKAGAAEPEGGAEQTMSAAQIEDMIKQRADARRRKDYTEADRIRKELGAQGIVLEDLPGGTTTWRRE